MKNPFKSLVTLSLALMTAACTPSCVHSEKVIEKEVQHKVTREINDARRIPYTSFVKIEDRAYYIDKEGDPGINHSTASGVIVFRSHIDSELAFVMTARHVCERELPEGTLARRFVVFDFNGTPHPAEFAINSDDKKDDVCILIMEGMTDKLTVAQLAPQMPLIGERVFNLAAPKGFFMPGVVTTFEGFYSGKFNEIAVYTVPIAEGSSGSPVFNSFGELVGIVSAYPFHPVKEKEGWKRERILEDIAHVVELNALQRILDEVESNDIMVRILVDQIEVKTKTSSPTKDLESVR